MALAGNIDYTSKDIPVSGAVSVGTTPVHLPSNGGFGHEIRELFVQADVNNTDDIVIGGKSGQAVRLHPDDDFVIPLELPENLWMRAVTGTQILNYMGRD